MTERTFATLNLNAFDDPHLDLAAVPVSYDGETLAERRARRRRRWTPVDLQGPGKGQAGRRAR